MNQFKRAQVIMLPTKNQSDIWSQRLGKIFYNKSITEDIQDECKYNLYVISDDIIKNNDWCYDKSNRKIIQVIYKHKDTKNHYYVSSYVNNEKEILSKGYSIDIKDLSKIIATTDTSLGYNESFINPIGNKADNKWISLPQPSQQFIEKYIQAYNKGEIITDVLVEYEKIYNGYRHKDGEWQLKLKINPKDNTITIKKLKDSWSREEVRGLLIKFYNEFPERYNLEQWIKENL